MIVPDNNLRSIRRPVGFERPARKSARRSRSLLWIFLLLIFFAAIAWTAWVYFQINTYAQRDEARPADAIAVFGAAEYDGRPSPVLKARLDHGLALYQEKLAPFIITLGGGDPADQQTEGGVGHNYLMAHGVPEKAIIAETESSNTEESAKRLAVIARANGLKNVLVVSDGSHLFRIHALCKSQGLTVFTSPRPVQKAPGWQETFSRTTHEILSYSLWRAKQAIRLGR
jgi:uncharacterized SAM-binding protein YcdF (DUF218 family)